MKSLKEPKGKLVTGQKWMFYMSALFLYRAGFSVLYIIF